MHRVDHASSQRNQPEDSRQPNGVRPQRSDQSEIIVEQPHVPLGTAPRLPLETNPLHTLLKQSQGQAISRTTIIDACLLVARFDRIRFLDSISPYRPYRQDRPTETFLAKNPNGKILPFQTLTLGSHVSTGPQGQFSFKPTWSDSTQEKLVPSPSRQELLTLRVRAAAHKIEALTDPVRIGQITTRCLSEGFVFASIAAQLLDKPAIILSANNNDRNGFPFSKPGKRVSFYMVDVKDHWTPAAAMNEQSRFKLLNYHLRSLYDECADLISSPLTALSSLAQSMDLQILTPQPELAFIFGAEGPAQGLVAEVKNSAMGTTIDVSRFAHTRPSIKSTLPES